MAAGRATRRWLFALVGTVAAAALLAAACGGNDERATATIQYPAEASLVGDGAPGLIPDGMATNDASVLGLNIVPAGEVLEVPQTMHVQFTAYLGTGTKTPVQALWSTDSPEVGSIDGNGLFVPTNAVGGTVNIYAQSNESFGTTTLRVHIHVSDIPPGFDPGVLGALQNGGQADSHFKWLYPYNQTVFPRGLLPPRLQWSGTPLQWVLVTASAENVDYQGVFAPTNDDQLPGTPTQLDLPADAWTAISETAGANDPVIVQVTKYDTQNAVTGPISETWTIAQGTLKGVIYYDTYDSPLAQGDAGSLNDMGAVMRLRPGVDTQPSVFIGGAANGSCTVCHTLSANGSTMALSAGHQYDAIYGVSPDASAPIGPLSEQPDNVYSFGALTPDGKYLLSCGSTGLDAGSDDGGPLSIGDYGPNVTSMTHELSSRLFVTADGGVVGSIPTVDKALMPAFSPDGTQIVFNRFVAGQDQRLAVASFNETTLTFGTPTDVFVDPGYYLGWPSFLPDSQTFVFQTSDDSDQYSTFEPVSYEDADGELFQYIPSINDVHHLRATMGQEDVGTPDGGVQINTYLLNPDGTIAEQDPYKNYEPTALPVAAGGYYWIVFTSRRSYGNTIDNSNPNDTPANVKPKKLWVAAIDINGDATIDTSHPALYLPGQELGAGNLRGFWSLPACQANGGSCLSGTDCCNGFCRQVLPDGGASTRGPDGSAPTFTCIAPPSSCSNVDERCLRPADCCGSAASGVVCIDGFCALPTPK
jgi:hypothetical protein